jgi:hypothetical protein
MNNPDWYNSWRHDAVHQFGEKDARVGVEFRLRDWTRYDYDLDAGTLIFSEQGAPRVIAEIQIVGTTSANAGNWLWAWANTQLPAALVADAELARVFGEEHGVLELTQSHQKDDDLNALAWELTAITARLAGGLGAYRPPLPKGGCLYLIYKSIDWAS